MIWLSLSLIFFCGRNLHWHVTMLLHCLYPKHRHMLPIELSESSWHQNQFQQKQVHTAEKCNYTLIQAKVAILHAGNPGTQFATDHVKRTALMSSGCRNRHSFCSKNLAFWIRCPAAPLVFRLTNCTMYLNICTKVQWELMALRFQQGM